MADRHPGAVEHSSSKLSNIYLIFSIFISNSTLTCLAISQFGSQDGVGSIYEGDCTTVGSLNRYIHVLINLLSTVMLSASNYYMQLQAAPTRANVQAAHN